MNGKTVVVFIKSLCVVGDDDPTGITETSPEFVAEAEGLVNSIIWRDPVS